MFPPFRSISIAKTDIFNRVGGRSGYSKIIRRHLCKCLIYLPARHTLREMVTKALQLKRAQFAYRSQGRKFFKAFVLWARAKARFHTLPVSLSESLSEPCLADFFHTKPSSTLSAPYNSYS